MTDFYLIIGDKDNQYLNDFSQYAVKKYINITFSFCDTIKEIYDSTQNLKSSIILLLTEELLNDLAMNEQSSELNNVIILSESNKQLDNYNSIFKYQNIDKIIEDVYIIASEFFQDFNISFRGVKTKSISIYSPCGGVGKSFISSLLSKYLAFNKKVFYMNLENNSSTNVYFDSDSKYGFSDLLLKFNEESDISMYLNAYKSKDKDSNVYFFKPFINISEILELTKDQLVKIQTTLKTMGEYDYIINDYSSEFNYISKYILETSDINILIIENTDVCNHKYKQFIKQLKAINNMNITFNGIIINHYNKDDIELLKEIEGNFKNIYTLNKLQSRVSKNVFFTISNVQKNVLKSIHEMIDGSNSNG